MTLYRRNGILLFVVGLVLLQVVRYVIGLPPEPAGPLRDLFMGIGILCPLAGGLACMAIGLYRAVRGKAPDRRRRGAPR